MIVNKRYSSAFVVDRSKLTRLMGVIQDSMKQQDTYYEEYFEVRLRGAKTVAVDSLQHVLGLDNSERSRIDSLVINCRAKQVSNDEPVHFVQVDFHGLRPSGITIQVISNDPKSAADIMSVVEEQVERTLERSLMYQLFGGNESFIFVTIVAMVILGGSLAIVSPSSKVDSSISNTMWLTPSDLADIEPMVRGTKTLGPDQMADVLSRQLRNVTAQKSTSLFSVLKDWRVLIMLSPAVLVVASFIALMYCYPSAVFLWGDMEEWYRRVLARRAWIWNVVVGALVLGILTNLAVFAFGSIISPQGT